MISVIICSTNRDISSILKDNIAETIGVDYELVVIDNSKNKYSLSSAYNEGVRRAQYSYLCFMHQDVLFHTKEWGKKVINHFNKNLQIGLIGVVGTHILSDVPSYWCDNRILSGNLIQGWTENNIYKSEHIIHQNYINNQSVRAIAVDGFWFCMTKSLFNLVSFDEKNFNDFHFYEMDICMQVNLSGFFVEIVMDILIEHFSYGNPNDNFYKARNRFYKKWKEKLPIVAGVSLSNKEINEIKKCIYINNKKKTFIYKKCIFFRFYSRLYWRLVKYRNKKM